MTLSPSLSPLLLSLPHALLRAAAPGR